MKILDCPLNGPRSISEFTYGGEYHPMPDPETSSARDWAEYVFFDENAAGRVIEWWCHTATAYWFFAERNTITDEIIRTWPAGDVFTTRVEFDSTPDDSSSG